MRHRDFTLFWLGQWVSVIGTWMQAMALSWLIYRLTDSALILGVLAAVRFGPSLLGSPFAGVLADRFPRRNLVLLTQSASLLLASALAALTLTGAVKVWHILTLALIQGVVDTLDMTARQTMQMDLVGPDDLQSAVALNSAAFNTGRMVAVAGVLVAAYGEEVCFAVNAISYLAVLVALLSIRGAAAAAPAPASVGTCSMGCASPGATHHPDGASGRRHHLDGRAVRPPCCRCWPDILKAGAPGYGLLLSCVGVGAIAGALGAAARRGNHGVGGLIGLGQAALGIGLVALGLEPGALDLLRLDGAGGGGRDHATGRDQRAAADHSAARMRGRVISLYIWFFTGLSPIGASRLAGWRSTPARRSRPWAAASSAWPAPSGRARAWRRSETGGSIASAPTPPAP